MKSLRLTHAFAAAALSLATCVATAASAAPTTAPKSATVLRVDDRKVVNMALYPTEDDAMRDVRRASRAGNLGQLPTSNIYVVQAKTADGHRLELTAKEGPRPIAGQTVQYDPATMEILP